MSEKTTLAQYVPDVMSHPWVVKLVGTVTTATGVSTILQVWNGVMGLLASTLGAMVTYAIWKKIKMEAELNKKETELRIRESELRIDALTKEARD